MSKKKEQQVKQENASAVAQSKPQEKTVSETQGTATKVEDEETKEVKHREPQLITVNGDKVTHAHAFQSNKNIEDWFYTAKINGVQLRSQHMTAEDVKAWQDRTLTVEDAMKHYFPTKLQKKVTQEEYQADNKLSDGRVIDKMNVYKEKDEQRQDFGKYKLYAQVGNIKLSKVMSYEDLNAFFDRVTTPAKLVEKNFGEQLNLASAYEKYQIPKDAGVEKVNISKSKDGKWFISASGTFGQTEKRPLSKTDQYSLFHTKTATKEQIAARLFQDGFKPKEEHKIAKSQAIKR